MQGVYDGKENEIHVIQGSTELNRKNFSRKIASARFLTTEASSWKKQQTSEGKSDLLNNHLLSSYS